MTIIYSNAGDDDCLLLQRIWQGLDDFIVIEVTPTSSNYEDIVDHAISIENDTLILCGHGTSNGLLFPDLNRGEYIIHENNVGLIHAKNVICSWCYASTFCINNNLHCFATSMYISNEREAYENNILNYSQHQINENSRSFFDELNFLLRSNVPINEWVLRLGIHTDIENEIDVFNRQGLYFG